MLRAALKASQASDEGAGAAPASTELNLSALPQGKDGLLAVIADVPHGLHAQSNTPYPAENNWALLGTATQSSDVPAAVTGFAPAAIDGNTDGIFANGSVTSTGGPVEDANNPAGPLFAQWPSYWTVDLGQIRSIGSI